MHLYMYSIIPFFGCQYKSTLSELVFMFCNPTTKNILSYLILDPSMSAALLHKLCSLSRE